MGEEGVRCRCGARRASPLTCLAVCFLVLTYNLLGGFLFLALEGEGSGEAVAASQAAPGAAALRARTVERLWAITEDLNILYKENWTQLAAQELRDFQRVLVQTYRSADRGEAPDYRWTFSTSFLYALTLITTIGHGNVTPKSAAGKAVAVAYACVGIPIIMVYLATLGEALARRARSLYARARPRSYARRDCRAQNEALADWDKTFGPKRTPFQAALNLDSFNSGPGRPCRAHARVPVLLSVTLLAGYVGLGAATFHATEKWSLVDGCYFSFASLATIGFGSLRPGASDAAAAVCCVYILVGVVVAATVFNLIREECGAALRAAQALCGGGAGRVTAAAGS